MDTFEVVNFEPLRGRSVMLTGASGLLGSNLLRALEQAMKFGIIEKVTAVVHTRAPETYLERGDLVYADLANPGDCARLPYADFVISAASYAQPMRFMAEPLMALRSSAYGVMALLERVNPGGRFMYISSSEVYCGCKDELPLTEESIGQITPYHPRACYIQGKMFGEAITYLYRQRGISTVAVRPGIIYGAGVRPGDRRSWASFIERAVRDGVIRLMDAGNVIRSFTAMQDGITLLLKIMLYGRQEVYNVTSDEVTTIRGVAEEIGKAAGVDVIIPEENKGVAGTPENLTLSNSRYMAEFGIHKFIRLNEGIPQVVQWWRDTYSI
jgi:nucleoside-diphosphate-sugar epimerase